MVEAAPVTPPKQAVVLYLYAGAARKNDIGSFVASLSSEAGFEDIVGEVDVCRSSEHDLLNADFWMTIKRNIKEGYYAALVVSPPCNTHTRSRNNRSNGPPPLRSKKYPWGFPWLEGPPIKGSSKRPINF